MREMPASSSDRRCRSYSSVPEPLICKQKAPLHDSAQGRLLKRGTTLIRLQMQPSAAKAMAFHGAKPPRTTCMLSPAKLGEEKSRMTTPARTARRLSEEVSAQ